MNSSEMAREVLHLKSTLLNLDEENALLKREANALSERLTLLEDAYHGHGLWKWAGAFEMDAGEYDWTFVGYSGRVKWNDIVLMLDTAEELQALQALQALEAALHPLLPLLRPLLRRLLPLLPRLRRLLPATSTLRPARALLPTPLLPTPLLPGRHPRLGPIVASLCNQLVVVE